MEITSLTNMGQGVARVDGWVVMVPFVIPGEFVKVRVYRNHKNYSEADLLEVLRPSEDRVSAPCPVFGVCGGCQYQMLGYEAQLIWKQRQVAELLQHMAKVEFPVKPVIASPATYGYRAKLTPHFAKPKEQAVGAIGFLAAGSRSRLVDVPHCPIALPEINQALALEREALREGKKQFKNGATLLLRSCREGVLTNPKGAATTEVNGLVFEFDAGGFFQNNPFILPAFTAYAARMASAQGARFLIDAYCGSGLFALTAARHFERVLGIELDEGAVARASRNAQRNNLPHAEFRAGQAERIFEAAIDFPPQETAVIIDPPRKGCDEAFLEQLSHFAPQTIVYISCNPSTQWRDMPFLLSRKYELKEIQPFDLFPQTKHLESVVTLTKV